MTDYKIKSDTTEIVTTATTQHSYFEVVKGIYAYKTVKRTTSSHPSIEDHELILQGLTKRSGITSLRKGLSPAPAFGNQGQMIVVSDEVLAEIKRFGYLALSPRYSKVFDDTAVYDWLIGGGSTDNVIRFYSYDHSFWRLDGSLLPTGMVFEYIDAGFHNLRYNLPKAVEHLNDRGDVWFFDQEKVYGKSISEIVKLKGEILPIPYYNADGGRNAFLSFVWTPEQDQAERLYADRQNRYKLVFDEDMLGLRAAGAALFDDFYKEVERSSSCGCCSCCDCD